MDKNVVVGRNTGADLLKIILAFFIVVNHSIGHGISGTLPAVYEDNYILMHLITTIANPAVNCFF